MKDKILAKVQETYERAKQIFGREFAPCRKVTFALRGGTAGQAVYGSQEMRFNLELAERQPNDFIARTVPHECAHLICYQMHGNKILGKPHGKEWKAIMVLLGCEPSRCHSYDTTGIKRIGKKYPYVCQCRKWEVSKLIHKRISEHGRKYTCKSCKARLSEMFP